MPIMPKLTADFETWQLADVQTSSRGIRSASITAGAQQPVYLQLTLRSDPLSTPFGTSSFNDETTTRKSLDLRCTPQLLVFMESLDLWASSYVAENSQRLFKGKQLEYKPCVSKKRGDYPETTRCKLNLSGQRACRFWSEKYEKIEQPEDLRLCGLVPRIQVKSLYIMGKECGLVLDISDLLCVLPTESCPFAEVAFE